MTIPMWAPFAFLAGVCAAYPVPGWVRRVDWLMVGVLGYCVAVWALVGFVAWWLVW